jgi:hypothetical protein
MTPCTIGEHAFFREGRRARGDSAPVRSLARALLGNVGMTTSRRLVAAAACGVWMVLSCSTARADQPAPPGDQPPVAQPQYAPQYQQPQTQYVQPQYGQPAYPYPPAGYAYTPPKTKRNSTAMYVIGLVSTILGGVTLLGGGITYATSDYIQEDTPRRTVEATGVGLLIGGAGLLALGIPFVVIGGERVPVDARIIPQATQHGGGAAVVVSF